MKNRHRRVTKLKKQELNVAKKKFENEYDIPAEDVAKAVNNAFNFLGGAVEGAGNILVSFGRSLQSK